jgi:hypothetical protein
VRFVLLVLAAVAVLLYLRRRRHPVVAGSYEPGASPAPPRSPAPEGGGAAVPPTSGEPPEDERVQALRARVAAGGSLSDDEREFLHAEGVDADPDRDPFGLEHGGRIGRGFWDEDRGRDLA